VTQKLAHSLQVNGLLSYTKTEMYLLSFYFTCCVGEHAGNIVMFWGSQFKMLKRF